MSTREGDAAAAAQCSPLSYAAEELRAEVPD